MQIKIDLQHCPDHTVYSHGWCRLAPNFADGPSLRTTVSLPSQKAIGVSINWSRRPRSIKASYSSSGLSKEDKRVIKDYLIRMFRIDEDFNEFWRLCRKDRALAVISRRRLGGLLRSPTLFEDLIKTLCTTNCHWRNTQNMVEKLCIGFGLESNSGNHEGGFKQAFPTPELLAKAPLSKLKNAGLGYRAPYVNHISRAVYEGKLDLDNLENERDSYQLIKQILELPGFGQYAASHMLMLLGHYDYIPCDSEVAAYLKVPPRTREPEVRKMITEKYHTWGKYKYLAFKLEWILNKQS